MKYFLVLCTIVILCSCASRDKNSSSLTPEQDQAARNLRYQIIEEKIEKGEILFDGGDGLSFENAIIINGAKNNSEGVGAEYVYIAKKHGERFKDWIFIGQNLIIENGKYFDELRIENIKNSKIITYYFDITSFLCVTRINQSTYDKFELKNWGLFQRSKTIGIWEIIKNTDVLPRSFETVFGMDIVNNTISKIYFTKVVIAKKYGETNEVVIMHKKDSLEPQVGTFHLVRFNEKSDFDYEYWKLQVKVDDQIFFERKFNLENDK